MTDAELKEICLEFRKGILGGRPSFRMCYVVCAPLQGYLSFLGIKTELEEIDIGEMNHFWLRLPDGRIIDPTGDQFSQYGGEPIYIGPEPPKTVAALFVPTHTPEREPAGVDA